MATRMKTTADLPATIDESQLKYPFLEEQTEENFEPDDLSIMNLLSELGSDTETTVRVYRQGKGGYRDLLFLFEVPPNEFSPTVLQNEPYNGGEFRIHARSKNGLVANKLIRVAPLPGQKSIQSMPDMSQAFAPMQNQINQLAGVIQQMAGFFQQSQQKSPSRMEILQEMQMMKEIVGGGGNNGAQQNPIVMVKEIFELTKTMGALGGGGGEPPDTLSVIMRAMEVFGKPIAEMAVQAKMNQAPVMQQAPQLPITQMPIHQNPIQTPINNPEAEAENMFKYYFGLLIKEAASDTDPTGYAHMIASKVPDELINELIRPVDYLERLAKIDDRVKLYPAWFSELREITLEILTPEPSPVNNGIISAPIPMGTNVYPSTTNTIIAGNTGGNSGDQGNSAINDPLHPRV